MIDVELTGIGNAITTIAGNKGKGPQGGKFSEEASFESFFNSKITQFEENMAQATTNQSNGQSHRPN